MEHVERQREINLRKKQDEGKDMNKTTREFREQFKQQTKATRNMITSTQMYNRNEITVKEDKMRQFASVDRKKAQHDAIANIEQAAYLEKLERS